ncbi:MAG TPA: acetyl-CoA carboxylase biotin carboxylase subunit [Ktedonobacterales bacterium]|nr:acetyl-CoA carboxylase biotin carboxylase subunit [Ktedonobacterales bacterium]
MARSASRSSASARTARGSELERFPFNKVLIANRGEIAVRIVRACRDLGLGSVAVFSDADRDAPHVRMADEAVHLGPAPSSESYLNVGKILDAARTTGAGAIHPGYGFLAENAEFADACTAAGIVFVGPPGQVMRDLGEKTAAKRIAVAAGVPIVPGYNAGLESAAQARQIAAEIGYPVLLKAAAGGGGKGIRFVRGAEELEAALRLAKSEAASAFGDDTVYLEKAVAPARHIEVQIFGDTHGNAIHLGERECSIQRRHQKLLEESPSVALDAELRGRLTGAAVALARAAGYVNAGTVEFLLGPDRSFYFLEVNTRLQVEHPVTELRTGMDLVREQLRVAAGLPLSVTQEEIVFRGHAVEARIQAEDALNRFMPATGSIAGLHEPLGPGVRVDSFIYDGMRVPLYYDSLLAKLICWGSDRTEALARLRRALEEFTIAGVRTTIPFHEWLVRQPRFLAGDFSTDFIAEEWHPEVEAEAEAGAEDGATADGGDALAPEELAALVAALVTQEADAREAQRRRGAANGGGTAADGSHWRAAGRRAAMGGW